MDRSHVDNILPQRLNDYMKEFEDDMNLTEVNIHDKTLMRSRIGCKMGKIFI